jgi:hypothetical protein
VTAHRLSRTGYRNPAVTNQVTLETRYDALVPDPDDPQGGVAVAERLVAESDRDVESWARPLERIHGSGLHRWGVALGLGVEVTIGQSGVTIAPGIALDAPGRHISLADGGRAEVRRLAPPGPAPPLAPSSAANTVTATGITLATPASEYPAGEYAVTIEWREAWLPAPDRYWVHVPWLRLLSGTPQAGIQIPLGRVTLNAAGAVTALTEGGRRGASVEAGVVQVSRSRPFLGKVQERAAGELRPRTVSVEAEGHGLELTVPEKGNRIELKQSDRTAAGALQEGAFAELQVRADRIAACRDDGKPTVILDSARGNVTAGGPGVEGDVLVRDAEDRLMVTLDGADGTIVTGGTGQSGSVHVMDSARAYTVSLDGGPGDVWFKGALRDTRNPNDAGVSHAELDELTHGGATKLHGHLVHIQDVETVAPHSVYSHGVASFTFGKPALRTAFIALTALGQNSGVSGHAYVARISSIDGVAPPAVTAFYRGTFSSVVFLLVAPFAWARIVAVVLD